MAKVVLEVRRTWRCGSSGKIHLRYLEIDATNILFPRTPLRGMKSHGVQNGPTLLSSVGYPTGALDIVIGGQAWMGPAVATRPISRNRRWGKSMLELEIWDFVSYYVLLKATSAAFCSSRRCDRCACKNAGLGLTYSANRMVFGV